MKMHQNRMPNAVGASFWQSERYNTLFSEDSYRTIKNKKQEWQYPHPPLNSGFLCFFSKELDNFYIKVHQKETVKAGDALLGGSERYGTTYASIRIIQKWKKECTFIFYLRCFFFIAQKILKSLVNSCVVRIRNMCNTFDKSATHFMTPLMLTTKHTTTHPPQTRPNPS